MNRQQAGINAHRKHDDPAMREWARGKRTSWPWRGKGIRAAVATRWVITEQACSRDLGDPMFLRKIVPGGADRSYGVHVAQLAGIPRPVVHRAQEILAELERKGEAKTRRKVMQDLTMPVAWQMTLFASETHPLLDEIKNLAIDELTPIEAISKLYELQQRARKEG